MSWWRAPKAWRGRILISRKSLAQGCMEVMAQLETALAEITGMDAVTLQPARRARMAN